MFSYEFEIDKEACFTYWVQSSIKWNWYFNQKEFDKWVQITGEFNFQEKKVLNSLKDILQKEENGYKWLWNKYTGNKINDIREQEKWNKIRKILENKFEIIWQSEYPKLLIWKDKLEQYNFQNLNNDFKKISTFFGVKNSEIISVKLFFGFGKKAGGGTKKEFTNLLILLLSGVDVLDLKSILKVLAHENIHLIEYSSKKDLLFRQSYKKILASLKIKQSQPSWRHLIVESIVSSIVGRDVGYLDEKIGVNENFQKVVLDKKNENKNQFYNRKITIVSKKIASLTKKYIKNNKEMDLDYTNQVIQEWKKEMKKIA